MNEYFLEMLDEIRLWKHELSNTYEDSIRLDVLDKVEDIIIDYGFMNGDD